MNDNQQNSDIPTGNQGLPKSGILPQDSLTIDLDKESSPQPVKYSIRTMAQDLERAKKETTTSAAIKMPTPPPLPPPKITLQKPIPPAPPQIIRPIPAAPQPEKIVPPSATVATTPTPAQQPPH